MSNLRILAVAASFRPESLNRKLLGIAAAHATAAGASITELDYTALDTPTYKDNDDAMPQGASRFAEALVTHHGLLMAVPEYNWSIPGGLKNLIDWVSTDPRQPFQNKTALLLCASPSSRGGISGLQQLRTPLEVLGCWVYPQLIGIGKANAQMQDGQLLKEADQQHLTASVTDFIKATNALVHARA